MSETVMVNSVGGKLELGVPLIDPLAALKINPAGRLGLIAKVNAPTPPLPETAVKAVVTAPCNRVLEDTTSSVTIGGLVTVKEKVLELVCVRLSVTVTVNVVGPLITLGVPLTEPVVEFITRPVGKLGLML